MDNHRLDERLRVVADRNRRRLLEYLRHEVDGEIGVATLVDHLFDAREATDDGGERERVAIRLHHVDLPRLAEAGVIEYDRERRTIEYQPDEALERILDSLPDEAPLANP